MSVIKVRKVNIDLDSYTIAANGATYSLHDGRLFWEVDGETFFKPDDGPLKVR